MLKRIACVFITVVFVLTLISGCVSGGQESKENTTPVEPEKSTEENTEKDAEEVPEDIVLTMIHQDTEKPERAEFYDRLAEKYNELHPNVTIDITKSTFSETQTTILTALSSGNPFDIFFSAVGDAKIWLEKDAALDLTEYLEANDGEWKNTLRDSVLDVITYGDGKIYGIPYYIDTTPLNYHKEIFEEYDVKPAQTKEEFYELCDLFKSEDYIPFQLHGSMISSLIAAISLQFAARDGIEPFDITSGDVPFTDPWFKDTLELIKDMYVRGYLPKQFWTIGGTDGRMAYSQGKMPMKFGFYWDVDTHKDMGMPYENQGVASLPNFTGKSDITLYKSVFAATFMISNQCKNPDTAVDFLKFLTNTENQDDMAYKYFGRYPNGMPVVNKNVKLSDYANEYMNDIASGKGTAFNPANVSLKYTEVINSNIPLFMEDKMTLDELVEEFDKLRED
jgi:raffinose/stachyose/melibiose transport system substrate-binding protein